MAIAKKFVKILIFIAFFLDKFLYYKDLKADEKNKKDFHHQIVGGYEIDFGKLNKKYDNHHLFVVPYAKVFSEKLKNFIESRTNLNQTISHKGHSHNVKDTTHNFKNKIVDVDTKFNFAFMTAYDLFMTTLLIYLFSSDSLTANFILLADYSLKLISREWKDLKPKSIFNSIYSFINDHMKKNYKSLWDETKKFVTREEVLALNVLLFSLLLLLFVINLLFKKKRGGVSNLEKLAEATSEVRKVIEKNLHEKIEDLKVEKSSDGRVKNQYENLKENGEVNVDREKEKIDSHSQNNINNDQSQSQSQMITSTGNFQKNEENSPEMTTLKTEETVDNIPPTHTSSFRKVIPLEELNIDENQDRKRKRNQSPSGRRVQKANY